MIYSIETEKQICTPSVKWYQNKEYVIITFDIYNGKNDHIKINENNINFYILSNDIGYKMNFILYETIDVENSKYDIMEKCVKIYLKKTSDNNWIFLTNDKNTYKNNIKIDWNNWTDESDEENNGEQFDLQQMMANMQGMQGMQDMFGGNNHGNEEHAEEEYAEEEYAEEEHAEEEYAEEEHDLEEHDLEENNLE